MYAFIHTMNATHTYPPLRNLASRVLFLGFALTTPSLYAQTFAGRDYLAESPVSIRAFVYPDARKQAIKIRLENRGAEAVRIRISDENQKSVYDDYVTKRAYYGRFDVSALPYGAYTIELSTQTTRHRQGFRLERLLAGQVVARHLVMAVQPKGPDSLLAQKPIVIKIVP